MTSRRPIVALYLEDDLISDPEHSDILTRIAGKYSLRTVRDKTDALEVLAREPPTVLVLDSAVTKPDNDDIADKLAHLAWAGSTVILAGAFARAEEADLKRMLSKNLGLDWVYRGKGREVAGLRRNVAGGKGLAGGYALEAVMLGNVLPISVWYGASVGGYADQSAVAVFGGYGEGKLGYVGDVNLEDKTKECLMAMLKAKV